MWPDKSEWGLCMQSCMSKYIWGKTAFGITYLRGFFLSVLENNHSVEPFFRCRETLKQSGQFNMWHRISRSEYYQNGLNFKRVWLSKGVSQQWRGFKGLWLFICGFWQFCVSTVRGIFLSFYLSDNSGIWWSSCLLSEISLSLITLFSRFLQLPN